MANQPAKPGAKPVAKAGAKPASQRPKPAAPAATTAPANGSAVSIVPGGPRKRERPQNSKDALNQTLWGTSNDHTLKKDIIPKFVIVRPKFEKGSLVFRPLSNWDYEAVNDGRPELDVYRRSQDDNDFQANWIVKYPAAHFIGEGDNTHSFLLYDERWSESDYDRRANPYLLIYNAVKKAAERDQTHPEWARLIKGKSGKGAIIPAPCHLFYVQAIIFKNGSDIYMKSDRPPLGLMPSDLPHFVQLKNTAGSGLLALANAKNPDWRGDPNDWENSMLHGDLIAAEHGRFITIYNPEHEKVGPIEEESLVGFDEVDVEEVRRTGGGSAKRPQLEAQGYEVRADKYLILGQQQYKTKLPAIPPKMLDIVKPHICYFEDVINLASNEEQAMWCARAYKGYRKVIEFAWQEFPEYLTPEIQKLLGNATQVSLTGRRTDVEAEEAPRRSISAEDEGGWTLDADVNVSVETGVDEIDETGEGVDVVDDADAEYDDSEYDDVVEEGAEEGEGEPEYEDGTEEQEVDETVEEGEEAVAEDEAAEAEDDGGWVDDNLGTEGAEAPGPDPEAEAEAEAEPEPAPAPKVETSAARARQALANASARTNSRTPVAATKPTTTAKAPPAGQKPKAGTKPAGPKPAK